MRILGKSYYLIFGLAAVLLAGIFAGCGDSDRGTTRTALTQYNESPPTSPYTPITTSVTLDVLNYRDYIEYASYISFTTSKRYSGNFLHIVGEFYNPSSQNVKLGDDKLEATFYDDSGTVIEVDNIVKTSYLQDETIPPGGKWPFRLVVLDEDISNRISSYNLSAKGRRISEEIIQIEIISYKLFPNRNFPDKYNDLIAEVQNTTDSIIEVSLLATFYDEQGLVIEADDLFIFTPLCPGEKAPFSLSPVVIEAKRCELVARCVVVDEIPYREFKVFNIAYKEGHTWDSLTGEIRNTGQQSVTNVYMKVSFYDEEGVLIDCGGAGVEPDTLEPGGTGVFEIEPLPEPPWQMPNYSLLIYALD
jgi:hypothetical protein